MIVGSTRNGPIAGNRPRPRGYAGRSGRDGLRGGVNAIRAGEVAGRVRVGGLLVTDNTLWSGKVADLSVKDNDTEGVRESNKMLYADDRYCPVLIPLRDGVAVGLRLK